MPTTIKAALKKWEEATGRKAGEAKEIKLIGVYPPIEKMEVQLMPWRALSPGVMSEFRSHYSRLFYWLFFQNSRAAKLNVFQNSSYFLAKLKENILKLNISEIFVEMGLFSIQSMK